MRATIGSTGTCRARRCLSASNCHSLVTGSNQSESLQSSIPAHTSHCGLLAENFEGTGDPAMQGCGQSAPHSASRPHVEPDQARLRMAIMCGRPGTLRHGNVFRRRCHNARGNRSRSGTSQLSNQRPANRRFATRFPDAIFPAIHRNRSARLIDGTFRSNAGRCARSRFQGSIRWR